MMGRMPSSYGRGAAIAAFVLALTLSVYAHAATITPAELLLQALVPPAPASPPTISPDLKLLPQNSAAPATPPTSLTPASTASDATTLTPTPTPKTARLKTHNAEHATHEAEHTAHEASTPSTSPAPIAPSSNTGITSNAVFTQYLTLRSTGSQVQALQTFLKTQNLFSGETTGYYGAVTQAAGRYDHGTLRHA
jgi:hypothetical protein